MESSIIFHCFRRLILSVITLKITLVACGEIDSRTLLFNDASDLFWFPDIRLSFGSGILFALLRMLRQTTSDVPVPIPSIRWHINRW